MLRPSCVSGVAIALFFTFSYIMFSDESSTYFTAIVLKRLLEKSCG